MSLRRRIMTMAGLEDDEMKEWKLLETRILEEPTATVIFDLPEGVNEVTAICKTMQERSDGKAVTATRKGSIFINGKKLISNVINYSGYNGFITTLSRIENLTAYIGGSCVSLVNPSISQSPVFQSTFIEGEEIKKIEFSPQYEFVTGLGDVGRFSAGSEFTVYYR